MPCADRFAGSRHAVFCVCGVPCVRGWRNGRSLEGRDCSVAGRAKGLWPGGIVPPAAFTTGCEAALDIVGRLHCMSRKELSVLLLLVVLCAIVAVASPQFLSATNIQNMARLIGTYGIFSIGVGIVIITGGIDLSIGSICALLGVLLSMMLVEWHWPPALALAAVIAIGGC